MAVSLFSFALVFSISSDAATLPAEWQYLQQFTVAAPGLVKLSLPVETIDAARPSLEDFRIYDEAGNEVPFLIERPMPAGKVIQNAKSFQVSLNPNTTVVTLETGMSQPIDSVTLESPATSFFKSVQIESSADGKRWQPLAQGRPIFRQSSGASQLRLTFPAGVWSWLRLTVDDQRSSPVPFTAARVHAAASEPAPGESLAVTIAERHENPDETRLTLNLGSANLNIASIQIETSEPLFTRRVTLAVPKISEDAVREQTLAQGTIYRVAVEGQPAAANLSVLLEAQVPARELLVLIKNHDSPPLPITAVGMERRPVYVVFSARHEGVHYLLSGNRDCAPPRYDLAGLGANLKNVPVSPLKTSSLGNNPSYRAPELLPGVQEYGTALDVSAWKFRKWVKLARAGAQQLEIDLDVLSHAQSGFQDLRLLREGTQLPFILERTSISRSLTPVVTLINDVKNPKLSRWVLKLSHSGLPVTRISCIAKTALFQRELTVYEEVLDDRGEKYRRTLGTSVWTQTLDRKTRDFSIPLDGPLRSDTLILETHNGDNPPVELEKFQLFHLATRLLFKTKTEDQLFLYYGNARVAAPRYDLNLVAGRLLTAGKAIASLAVEEQLKKSLWSDGRTVGKGGVLFWGVLALVVVALLIIISRLLPKPPPPGG